MAEILTVAVYEVHYTIVNIKIEAIMDIKVKYLSYNMIAELSMFASATVKSVQRKARTISYK